MHQLRQTCWSLLEDADRVGDPGRLQLVPATDGDPYQGEGLVQGGAPIQRGTVAGPGGGSPGKRPPARPRPGGGGWGGGGPGGGRGGGGLGVLGGAFPPPPP